MANEYLKLMLWIVCMHADSLRMLCRYSILLFLMRLLVHMIRFYLVSKQFHYSIIIFAMRFLAFYRLIDKISSFLPFRFPPFSHFFRRLTHYSQKYSLSLNTHKKFHSHMDSLLQHIHSTSRIFTLLSLLSVSQHVSLKTWNGPLFNSMSYPLL